MSFPTGYVFNEERIAAATSRMESAGFQVSFEQDRPQLRGWWEKRKSQGITAILAQDDEFKLFGEYREPNSQHRGTCVGQGSSRAIEDVHTSRVVDKAIVDPKRRVLISYEAMYAFERKLHFGQTHQWGCQCGRCPDGLQGMDAAAFYATKGVLQRMNYEQAGIDLSQPHEELAIQWNNSGVPEVLIAAAAFHKIQCHRSSTWDEFADAIAAKHWGHVCLQGVFQGGHIDRFGCCEPDNVGPNWGHDTECCGVVELPSGETAFVMQQSWGNAIKYPGFVQTKSNQIKLRPSSYAVRKSVLQSLGTQIELISCDIPSGSSFR